MDTLDLEPIVKPDQVENVIHGTYYRFWDEIKVKGLSRMKRNHIHFAPGLPKTGNVISGMRSTCQIFIYVDLDLALKSGVNFYKSSNNVILSSGDDGILKTKYFLKVVDARTGMIEKLKNVIIY